MLVYDGSPKSKEGLYIATYLATRYKVTLVIFATKEGDQKAMEKTVAVASRHLRKHGIDAENFERRGPIATAIRDSAVEAKCDVIVTGGYSHHPLFGPKSSLDELLRITVHPVLICR